MRLPLLLHKLLFAPTNRTLLQFARYGAVAVIALAFDFGTYAFLITVCHVHPVLAATVGFSIGIVVNYLLSVYWVFSERARTRRAEMIGFLIIGLVGLMLTNLIIWLVAVFWQHNELLAKLVAVVIVFFWNFGARKWLLFNKESL